MVFRHVVPNYGASPPAVEKPGEAGLSLQPMQGRKNDNFYLRVVLRAACWVVCSLFLQSWESCLPGACRGVAQGCVFGLCGRVGLSPLRSPLPKAALGASGPGPPSPGARGPWRPLPLGRSLRLRGGVGKRFLPLLPVPRRCGGQAGSGLPDQQGDGC